MSSCVSQYTYIHAVNFPLDIFTIRENSFSNCTALHNSKLLTDDANMVSTLHDDFKCSTTLTKLHIDTCDHRPIA